MKICVSYRIQIGMAFFDLAKNFKSTPTEMSK